MKIAVYMPNWVGDAVMATPALRGVRDRYADAEIVAVLRPPIGDVLAGTSLVDRTIVWNPRGRDANPRGWRLIRALRRERFDLAILFPNSLRSGWLAWCSGAKRRVGFARNGRGVLLTDAIEPKPRTPPHPVIDEYARLAEHLGCRFERYRMELATEPADEERLAAFLATAWQTRVAGVEALRAPSDPQWASEERSAGGSAALRPQPPFASLRPQPPDGGPAPQSGLVPPYVCLNPGGAFGAAKHWPTPHFALLARRVAEELGRRVLVVCGPAEQGIARMIVRLAAHPAVVSLADASPSIGLTKAAVRRCELLVTTDSGPRHFAGPFGVPAITLFGPTHIAWSETYQPNAVHLQIPVDCGPCQKRTCPLVHHRCMTELSVERVFGAVAEQLERTNLGVSRAA